MKLRKILSVSVAALMLCIFTFSQIGYGVANVDDLRQKRTAESSDRGSVGGQIGVDEAIARLRALIRTELREPEGQPKGFFTSDYHSYVIGALLAEPVEQIPDEVVSTIKKKLDQDIAQGKLLGAVVRDFGGTEIDIQVTHRYGELNAAVQRLITETMKEGALKAQELGLLKKGTDVASMDLVALEEALRVKYQPHSITERGSEPVVIVKMVGAGIGAANIKLYHEFFITGSTPLQKLGFVPEIGEKDKPGVRGFRAIVRRTEDVLKGNLDGPVWEFEKSAALKIGNREYPSKDESLELMALASQPNDFVITAIYTVEGSAITSTEPIVSVVYQAVYGEKGNLRTLNPTFICRSQSGADAVGGVASMFYDVNFVPGGPNGENFVVTRPTTLEEARKAPKKGTAHVVIYGWQSKGNGIIPKEEGGILDHVAINPEALEYEQELADFLASVMTTHENDEPYNAPFATEERVAPIRKEQTHLFTRAPKEADIDPVMDGVEAKVVSGESLSVTDDKADMGGKFGHNFTPEYMLGIDRATVSEAVENGTLSDGNIIGFTHKGRLKRGTTTAIGDDSHIIMLGDKSRNSAEGHQLSFLAFTRGYLFAVVNGEKPYGLAQDYQGKEAKAAKVNPYFYSHLSERFFEILREVMPEDHLAGIEKMYAGWKEWQKTSATVTLPEPFSGNVSQQGIGSARYLVDIAGGERVFGILAGDKMGPAALNRPIREGVYAALKAGKLTNGLVFEIWDAKAFDEHGNIAIDELPEVYADIADSIAELKNQTDKDFVKNAYTEGRLRNDLTLSDKIKLAELIKQAGFVPTKRIFLDAEQDKEAIYLYLAHSDRFNIKQVWSKKTTGWDINNFQAYLDRPILGSSVTKLGILAGGEYIGKDDPVMVGHIELMEHIWAFLKDNPLIIQGDMNGSHWLGAIPTRFKYAVANKDSHPILVGLRYTLSDDGKSLANVEDIFDDEAYSSIRQKMFGFNVKFKQACLGGQFEPYGTNWRTVEASYPLAKFLRALQSPDSRFLVSNKPEVDRKLQPIGVFGESPELFRLAATAVAEAKKSDKGSPLHAWKVIVSSGYRAGDTITTEEFAQLRNWSRSTRGYELQSLVAIGVLAPAGTRGEYKVLVTGTSQQIDQISSIVASVVDRTGRNGKALGLDSYRLDAAYLGKGDVDKGNAKLTQIADVISKSLTPQQAPIHMPSVYRIVGVPVDFIAADIAEGKPVGSAAFIEEERPFTIAGQPIAAYSGISQAGGSNHHALLAALIDMRLLPDSTLVRNDIGNFEPTKVKTVLFKDTFVTGKPEEGKGPDAFAAEFAKLEADQIAVIVSTSEDEAGLLAINAALNRAGLSDRLGERIIIMAVKPDSPSAEAFTRLFGDKYILTELQTAQDILKNKDAVIAIGGAV